MRPNSYMTIYRRGWGEIHSTSFDSTIQRGLYSWAVMIKAPNGSNRPVRITLTAREIPLHTSSSLWRNLASKPILTGLTLLCKSRILIPHPIRVFKVWGSSSSSLSVPSMCLHYHTVEQLSNFFMGQKGPLWSSLASCMPQAIVFHSVIPLGAGIIFPLLPYVSECYQAWKL